jgi:hypothetical protein
MKRIFLIALLFTSISSFAQNFQLGLKAGVNLSNFIGGKFDTIENNALVGFHAGAFVRFMFDHFAIQPEALISTQGAKLKHRGVSSDYKITYVNVPVLIQYESDKGFYGEGGLQIGFKVGENVPNTTIENFAKNADVAIPLGLGYHSKMGLGFGARYNFGVSKVGDFEPSSIDPNFSNGVMQFSLFYTFFNKKK